MTNRYWEWFYNRSHNEQDVLSLLLVVLPGILMMTVELTTLEVLSNIVRLQVKSDGSLITSVPTAICYMGLWYLTGCWYKEHPNYYVVPKEQ